MLTGRCSIVLSCLALWGCPLDERTLEVRANDNRDASTTDWGSGGVSSGGPGSDSGSGGASSSSNDSGGSDTGGGSSGGAAASDGSGGRDRLCVDLDDNGVPDCDETLARNPSFDHDIEAWEAEHLAQVSWSDGADDDPERAGNIVVTNLARGGGAYLNGAASYQCLRVDEYDVISVFAEIYNPVSPEEPEAGLAALGIAFYDSNNCSGNPLEFKQSPVNTTRQRWRPLDRSALAPADANSASVLLTVLKLGATLSPMAIHFDNVLVRKD